MYTALPLTINNVTNIVKGDSIVARERDVAIASGMLALQAAIGLPTKANCMLYRGV
jgi:hypothetical protein